ncbi:carboxylating nicotinate-nucleotide diphosphorylase [Thermosynechococcus sp. GLH187]|uniref:carboxylating nicotinate-nucleotide diphosphorylase n=1 Tax=unclassified Thermosynechococcus TaxID=2622553 RepID=UPI0028779961|nr:MULTISPECIES: carboxylating nicotinate-nucleotide diphosphorylase [unclassified Thermosynechococcus]WNC44778.1 carboxylating nicotinate-nucleotide diphosphorylase [Thermosynechococcus sp. GLH187]WNC47314.1 carboxylating nicotinate-nucleotide diphosphorylase [Thermosynechococcus sp. GLH333]WNC49851.1 carboxylating nicotinate-nucleotide diphosphorylase [Thermosynechococcus sp. GLH87]WNC52388.1 carboxylating nicotinate-nucleotide diphosphorylase [Thermosynechococcus sp. TG215]WNC57474.1 carbox
MSPRGSAYLPPWCVLDPLLDQWLQEDIGRGDRTTQALHLQDRQGKAHIRLKSQGVIAGLPIVERVFQRLTAAVVFNYEQAEGTLCEAPTIVARIEAPLETLLLGERLALNCLMRLSGIATLTRTYAQQIADLPTQLVDTRKTTPGLRLLEKYAVAVGGGVNHRFGLDDAIMIKDNHIVAAGGITAAVEQVRQSSPFPLAIEVETESLEQVREALSLGVEVIMLDNMPIPEMTQAVAMIRAAAPHTKIEASGNITLETLRAVALTGVDYISTSAIITRSPWLDFSLTIL